MPPAEQPADKYQVGITNAQEKNPDAVIADLTGQMNAHFAAGRYAEAAAIALRITARSREELADTFARHGVTVLHLDHEAFGIYQEHIEPTYDVNVEGAAGAVLAAAAEFGTRHAQEMILIVRKPGAGDGGEAERLGLTVLLDETITLDEAVEVTGLVRDCGFGGATFAPKRRGSVTVYHTDDLGMSPAAFEDAAVRLVDELKKHYPSLSYNVQSYIIQMPTL